MAEATRTGGIVGSGVAITTQPVAIGHQPLQTNGPARGKGLGADAHFRSEPVAETISKARGTVVINTGTVD